MISKRMLFTFGCVFSAVGMAAAQAPPSPPSPPAPPAAAVPAAAPLPPAPPEPPLPPDFLGPELNQLTALDSLQSKIDGAISGIAAQLGSETSQSAAQARFFQRGFYGSSNDDRLYETGQRALDRSQWEQALADFTRVANGGGSRADGALYWKAYVLNKLGRRDEALAAISDLRKSNTKSRWLDDAGALEIQIKQQAGQTVSPDGQPDEELKLIALNAFVSSDPDRALPLIENLLKSAQSPRIKERALFVLAQSNSPRAQQTLDQMARGNGNPDVQLRAIQYLGLSHSQSSGQVLADIYGGTSDTNVKRAVLHALRTEDRNGRILVDLARKERDPEMKRQIVQQLSTMRSKEATDYLMELLK
ncbi:MAG: HEAT repeat domain-containing protein [Acidobacteriia bacterium]|nr:HEAT repeat domain-containing protein [Terriglobia bacterium]